MADMSGFGELQCAFVRSTHAHARIITIDTAAASTMPGIVAILTWADMVADRVVPMRPLWTIKSTDGRPMAEPPRPQLAADFVRHVGEPIALVVAQTVEQALDATEAVTVKYEPLPAVTNARYAMQDKAPLLHAQAPGNVVFHFERGDGAAVDAILAQAPHIVRLALTNNRLVCAAMEPRAVLTMPDPTGRLVVYCTTQAPHHIRQAITEELGLPVGAVRVVAPDVGGGFGTKGKHYPEETVLPWAAQRLGRPLKWVATRTESFITDTQARDHFTLAEMGIDQQGHFLALKVETIANIGAYVSTFGASIPSVIYSGLLAGPYRTPAVVVRSTGVFTNTVPTDAYRGAGRPEACYVLERLADEVAHVLALDRAEVRRRNLITREAMPYRTPLGTIYDSGDFPGVLEKALTAADYAGFSARRAATEAKGYRRGFGVASFVESSGVAPSRFATQLGARAGFYEAAHVRVHQDGGVLVMLGTHNHGQGHATTFAQIIASRLGVPATSVEIIEGDTDIVPQGTGTFGSRSIAVGGSALAAAIDKTIAKGRKIASFLLEAAEADIEFADGHYKVAGTDRRMPLVEVAHRAYLPGQLPMEIELGLQETAVYDPSSFAWSNGAHLCEVEVDPETGIVDVVGYWCVDDIGTVINPMIVEGQIHGGIAQGLGQVLSEHCVYDTESGQPLTGSLMDYALQRAGDMPPVVSALDESQPCTHNPLGAKGCGETGSIGAPAAVVGAVLDALRPLGVHDIEMPLTPGRVWAAIRNASGSEPARA